MTKEELSSKVSSLHNRAPITAQLTVALARIGTKNPADGEHFNPKKSWIGWLEKYNGRATQRRKDSNRTARFIYNILKAPSMALWLGEASGVPKDMVHRALNAAIFAQPNPATQTAAIRRIIPWDVIEDRLKATSDGRSESIGAKQASTSAPYAATECCVYTIVEGKELRRLAKEGCEVRREERQRWVTAENLWLEAHPSNKALPVVFGDASNCSRLLYWGLLTKVHVHDGGTSFVVDCLRKINGNHAPQELVLRSTNKHIAPHFIRPYALCLTPPFLNPGDKG